MEREVLELTRERPCCIQGGTPCCEKLWPQEDEADAIFVQEVVRSFGLLSSKDLQGPESQLRNAHVPMQGHILEVHQTLGILLEADGGISPSLRI